MAAVTGLRREASPFRETRDLLRDRQIFFSAELHSQIMAPDQGFEPRLPESESGVLPLHQSGIW